MQSSYWNALLRRIPVEEHNKLMIVTSSGTEVTIQSILMYDGDCLAIKGRLSGSQDAGRVYFIPYEHIDYVGFVRAVTDDEFRAYFGEGGSMLLAEFAAAVPAPVATTAPTTRTTAMPTMILPPTNGVLANTPELQTSPTVLLEPTPGVRMPGASARTPIANRAALLESIRARGLTPRPTPPNQGSKER